MTWFNRVDPINSLYALKTGKFKISINLAESPVLDGYAADALRGVPAMDLQKQP